MADDRTAQSARLIGEEGILKGQVLALDDGTSWTIGRDPDQSDIVIEDPAASRKHLLCRATDEGFILENLSSTNPITVNDIEVTEPQQLQDGDLVIIGASKFRFYSSAGPAVDSPSTKEAPEEHVFPGEKPQPASVGMETPQEQSDEEPPIETDEEEDTLTSAAPEEEAADVPVEEEPAEEVRRDTLFEEPEQPDQGKEVSEADMFADTGIDLTGGGRWMLKVISGPNNGAEFGMQSGESYVMGNDPSACDIVFHDISVSRQHARLSVTDEDALSVEDLGSRNGTQVDGDTIEERPRSSRTNWSPSVPAPSL